MTIAAMVLVNNPGSWSTVYSPFLHADWHGLTPTDLIFPFFLFIVGISISFALGKRIGKSSIHKVYLKIIRRFLLIFLIGIFLNTFGVFDFSTLRIPGVLQRIAICYLVASIIFLNTSWKQQTGLIVSLLLIYWLLMTVVSVPGCTVTTINDRACNLSAYIDRLVLGVNHIWAQGKVFDPEGLLSTVPAIATTLVGVLTGTWIKTNRGHSEKLNGLFFFGLVLLALGWVWSFWLPMNKSIWTGSYSIYTAGAALCFLGSCIWLIDVQGFKRWSKPFEVFGMNALALYIGSAIFAQILDMLQIAGSDGASISLKEWIYETVFTPALAPKSASLAFAVSFMCVWYLMMWVFYRRRIFIKV